MVPVVRFAAATLAATLLVLIAVPPAPAEATGGLAAIGNFDSAGRPLVRFDTSGRAVDAHDGELRYFSGTYYLYGSSYACGFAWLTQRAPFCGFKVYSSPDLVRWTDRGLLFDARTFAWQVACNGSAFGCFRPHVVYNASTGRYVLWLNALDVPVGYHVFTAVSPVGPFIEQPLPTIGELSTHPGVNSGDLDVFVDDGGTAYLARTDITRGHQIVIDELDSSYLTTTGRYTVVSSLTNVEAPSLFKHAGTYYLAVSDPLCAYCMGTGTSYVSAVSALGTWSAPSRISANSCGGQPAAVSVLPTIGGPVYLYQSDLWRGTTNEALATSFWAPLAFEANGVIDPIRCQGVVSLDLAGAVGGDAGAGPAGPAGRVDQSTGSTGFHTECDIAGGTRREQTFPAGRSGVLSGVAVTTFQDGWPDSGLTLTVVSLDAGGAATTLGSRTFPVNAVAWAPAPLVLPLNVSVSAQQPLAVVLSTAATQGCFGIAAADTGFYSSGSESVSRDAGISWQGEPGRVLRFFSTVDPPAPAPAVATPTPVANAAPSAAPTATPAVAGTAAPAPTPVPGAPGAVSLVPPAAARDSGLAEGDAATAPPIARPAQTLAAARLSDRDARLGPALLVLALAIGVVATLRRRRRAGRCRWVKSHRLL